MARNSDHKKKSSKSKRTAKPIKKEVAPRRQESLKETQHRSMSPELVARVEECLPSDVPPEIKDLMLSRLSNGEEVQGQIFGIERSVSATGFPIPLPQTLAEYSKVDADIVPRFLRAWESEEKTRQRLEDEKLRAQIDLEHLKHKERSRGQFYGLSIGLAGMLISAYMVYKGFPTQATIFGSGTIVSLVAVFVLRRLPTRKDKAKESIPLEDHQNDS